MAAFKIIFLVAFALISNTYCEEKVEQPVETEAENTEPKEEDNVLILTDKNIHDTIKKHKVILIEFYAPWCGHCKQLTPVFAKAAKTLKESDPPVALAKVDCTIETKSAEEYGIGGYPTLYLFKDGVKIDFDGGRDYDSIVNFVKERADPNYKPPPESVITLTKDNFNDVTTKEDIILVEFYSKNCGHCKTLAPELEKAAKQLETLEKPIPIAKVDAVAESELAKRFEVNAYPTMKVFKKGKHSEYKGPREAAGIAEHMRSLTGLPTKLYSTKKDVMKWREGSANEVLVLGVFEDESDPMMKLYVETNEDKRDEYQFGHTFSKDFKKMVGLKKSGIVMIHPEALLSKHEPKYRTFTDENGSPSELSAFYEKYQVTLVGHYQQQVEKRYKKRPLCLVFYDVNFAPTHRDMTNFWRKKVLQVAKNYPDIQFAVANEEDYQTKLDELQLTDTSEEINVGLYDKDGKKFSMVGEDFSEETLTEFIDSFLAGDLKAIIKSATPPAAKPKPGDVQVVVGTTFDQIVMDETKEVFVEIYAPWCGHCKAIEQHLVEVAKKLKSNKNIVIVKIDGTANDVPPYYSFTGFPTMYYAMPGKKDKPISFDGGRDTKGIMEFIEKHSNFMQKKKEEL